MDYLNDIKPRLDAGKNTTVIAEELTAERKALASNYRKIEPHQVAFWLADNGLQNRVDKWLSDQNNISNPYYDILTSAWDGVKAMRANMKAFMSVGPGEKHRDLILLAISLGVMTNDDLSAIDQIAYVGGVVTVDDVQGVIDNYNSDAAQWQRAVTAGALVIEAGGTFAEAMAAAGGV